MKSTSVFLALLIASAVPVLNGQSPPATSQTGLAEASAYSIKERGANHRLWERVEYSTNLSGTVIQHVHNYTELATGLHYWDAAAKDWKESGEQIEPVAGGAAAVQGQHKAFFPYDLSQGLIEMVTPEGQSLKSRPLCLSYFDGNKSVIIAALTGSAGQLVGSNQVIYETAFTNAQTGRSFKADVVYTYKKGSFEQDIVLRQQPPTPESFGLKSAETRLEVLTEFFDSAQPQITSGSVQTEAGQIQNDQLSFGVMKMGTGRAFTLGTNSTSATITKRWLQMDGRQILLEEVPVAKIQDGLAQLPLAQAGSGQLKKASRLASASRVPPARSLAKAPDKRPLQVAKATPSNSGLVLDYQTVNGSLGNYTFRGDTTYYVSSSVNISGIATFEGGAVIKYAPNTSININYPGSIQMLSSPYRPVVFTAKDDNSIGDIISGSTGSPSGGYYANPAINYNGAMDAASGMALGNFRIAYAQTAISAGGISISVTLSDGQIVNCATGFYNAGYAAISARNVLFAKFAYAFLGSYMNIHAQNCTFDGILFNPPVNYTPSFLVQGNMSTILLNAQNCVLANVTYFSTDPSRLSGDHNGFYNNGSAIFGTSTFSSWPNNPFQTAGGGKYYLATNPNGTDASTFRNVGTISIDSGLLADLKQKTTYPPIVYTSANIAAGSTFSPRAQRDPGVTYVDLGWHYPPLDYGFGHCTAQGNLTFTAGTAAGWFNTPPYGYGVQISDATVTFNGTQASPNYWVRLNTVQEQELGSGYSGLGLSASGSQSSTPAVISARFTRFSIMANDGRHILGSGSLIVQASHCELWDGGMDFYTSSAMTLANCLFDRCIVTKTSGLGDANLRNCTMRDGTLALAHYEAPPAGWQSSIRDCAFDGTLFSLGPVYVSGQPDWSSFDFDYNAFSTTATGYRTGTHDVSPSLSSFDWQTGPLGGFYLPSGSLLIDHGSQTAGVAGLYDFTTQTAPPNTREGISTVDIGYHHVGVNGSGTAIDSNSDNIPDWWEDLWGIPVGISDGLHSPSADPDGDGLSNLQEFQLGTNPVRPDSLTSGGTYKTLRLASTVAPKAYDVYYRPGISSQWRRISSGSAGQKAFTFVNPNPTGDGDYIFLDAADDDGDGLSNGYEDWYTYIPGANIVSACAPRTVQLTCPNFRDSDGDLLLDGWKVAYGLNAMQHDGLNDPNDPNYVRPGDTLSNKTKQDNYYARLNTGQAGYANYDPLNVTATATVRPVATIFQSPANAYNQATFTISRDVGAGSTAALVVYYAVGGGLTYGIDYTLTPAPVIANGVFSTQIDQNQTSVTVTITVTPSALPKEASSLIVTLTPYGSMH